MSMGEEADRIIEDWLSRRGDEDEYFDENDTGKQAVCRDCGSENVYWGHDSNDRWCLYNLNSRKHVCDKKLLSSIRQDAFDVL